MLTFKNFQFAKQDEFLPVPEIKAEYLALLDCGLTASIGLDKVGIDRLDVHVD